MSDITDKVIDLSNEIARTTFEWCKKYNYPEHMGAIAVEMMHIHMTQRLPVEMLVQINAAALQVIAACDRELIAEQESKL